MTKGDTTQTHRIRRIHFTKMHGCGNNYIYVYLPDNPIADLRQASIDWSRQGFGIGSDGLITIERSEVADFRMRIFNNDGSEAMMCGNGVRCCGKFVRDHHLTNNKVVTFETLAGIKTLWLQEDEKGVVTGAKVDMGEPMAQDTQFTVSSCGREFQGVRVSMGNPHFVIFLDEKEDIETFDVTKYGSILEHHEAFPDGCNIEFAQKKGDVIRMRVWERGSGITMACGTGACATSVAATLTQEATHTNTIQMDGGKLMIEWNENDGHIYMTGPAERVYEGVVER